MYGPCLSSIETGRPLRPVTRHCLGGLLPRQLADRKQALPRAACAFTLAGLSGINPSFDGLSLTWGEIPTYYSLVRHSKQKVHTHPGKPFKVINKSFAFDLHVLGAPPAFILSYDQTL